MGTGVLELVERNRAFGLEADVEDDGVIGDPEDLRLDDLALDDLRHGALVHREHLLVFCVGVVFVVEVVPDAEAGGGDELIVRGGGGFLFSGQQQKALVPGRAGGAAGWG